MKLLTLVIFFITYFLLIFTKERKALITWAAVGVLMILGALSLSEGFTAINWNVIGLFAGTLIIADLFIFSNAPALFADWLIKKASNVGLAILYVCILASAISAFVENVATVLIVAPIALELAKRCKISPVLPIIAIAICSNLQGTATLVGDPPSMIMGAFAHMNFNDFFWFHNKPGIFFAVQVGALVSFAVLYFLFRKFKQPIDFQEKVKVLSWLPSILMLILIFSLAGMSFLPYEIPYAAGKISMLLAFVGLLWFAFYHKRFNPSWEVIKKFDYETLFFLMGIFVLVSSLTKMGIIQDLAIWLKTVSGDNLFLAFSIIVWASVFLSAFIDNVPYVLAMLPATQYLAMSFGVTPYLFYFGLLVGASVGGNITPIGASANVVACGLLRKHHQPVTFSEFVRIGLPFTLAAVFASYLFLWFVWH